MRTYTIEQTASTAPSAAATSINLAFSSANKQRSLLVAVVSYESTIATEVSSITDTRGNTWTRINGTTTGVSIGCEMWYAYNVIGGANTVTVNLANSREHALILREYSGVAWQFNPLDKSKVASQTTGTSHSTGSTTRTEKAVELLVTGGGCHFDGNELSAGTNWLNFTNVGDATTDVEACIEDRIVTSPGLYSGVIITASSTNASEVIATFKMDVPTFRGEQTATYSDSANSTSKQIALTNNTKDHSLLVLVNMDNYTAVNNISSVSDNFGHTWTRATSVSNSAGVNGEIWYAYAVRGGIKPTVTVNYSNTCTANLILREYSGVMFMADPLDQASSVIDATSTYSTPASGVRGSTYQLIIAAFGWNSATLGGTVGTLYTNYQEVHNATSNNRAAIEDRDVITGVTTTGTITMSGATSTACMQASFHLAAFHMTTSEDGYVDRYGDGLGGYITTAYPTGTDILSYMTSSASPDSTNPTSGRSYAYWFFDLAATLPNGAIITGVRFHYFVQDAYNDGLADGWQFFTSETAALGSTLEAADYDGIATNSQYYPEVAPFTTGWKYTDLLPKEVSRSAVTNIMLEPHTSQLNGSYTNIGTTEGGTGSFLEISWKLPLLPGQGVG